MFKIWSVIKEIALFWQENREDIIAVVNIIKSTLPNKSPIEKEVILGALVKELMEGSDVIVDSLPVKNDPTPR